MSLLRSSITARHTVRAGRGGPCTMEAAGLLLAASVPRTSRGMDQPFPGISPLWGNSPGRVDPCRGSSTQLSALTDGLGGKHPSSLQIGSCVSDHTHLSMQPCCRAAVENCICRAPPILEVGLGGNAALTSEPASSTQYTNKAHAALAAWPSWLRSSPGSPAALTQAQPSLSRALLLLAISAQLR